MERDRDRSFVTRLTNVAARAHDSAMSRLLLVPLLLASFAASAATTFKVGTLVPRESPWGTVLRVWQKAVKEKTKGEVTIEIFWNATQGDEPVLISKVKTGQLDSAIVSAVGLGLIDPNINVLQVPGLYAGWAELDKTREVLKPRFEASFREKGFELVGWGDIGLMRLMSKGYPVHLPSELKGKRPWVWREDLVMPSLYQVLGVVAVPTSTTEVLPELATGNIDALVVSALEAEQLQWSSRLDHLNMMVVAPNIGGAIVSKPRVDALPPEQKAVILDTIAVATRALSARIRVEDQQSLERLKKRMTVIEPTAEERGAWKKVFDEARARLARGALPADLLQQAQKLAQP